MAEDPKASAVGEKHFWYAKALERNVKTTTATCETIVRPRSKHS
jgi:hypothetical protein